MPMLVTRGKDEVEIAFPIGTCHLRLEADKDDDQAGGGPFLLLVPPAALCRPHRCPGHRLPSGDLTAGGHAHPGLGP